MHEYHRRGLTVHDTLSVRPLAPTAADRYAHHRVALRANEEKKSGHEKVGLQKRMRTEGNETLVRKKLCRQRQEDKDVHEEFMTQRFSRSHMRQWLHFENEGCNKNTLSTANTGTTTARRAQ